ncbi:MAG TPA: TAXI family TRAP transporter solute-binding subunit [Desulfosarcina sp.]|nr:TAXI family TRAP transporter solute-binding subunit [Desulfosarcina sp.]
MKKNAFSKAWITALLLIGCLTAADAEQAFLGIVTGDQKSTAHHIGMDLKALMVRNDIHLAVFDSYGSVENIYAVYQRPGNHLGIVQSDVLAFVGKIDSDHRLRFIADKIKWIFPLYDMEVHILAADPVHRFDDLQGRRVAVGHVESGTYLTSRLLFEISGITPSRMAAIGEDQALAALKAGSVDALVCIDGMPGERLALDVSAADGLHLVSITHGAIREFYPASRIPAGTYAWQTADVDTVSVKAVLVAYDFRNHHCRTIGTAARLVVENLDWLRRNGHPKWQSVDLTATVPDWQRYQCVGNTAPDAVAPIDAPSTERKPNPVADAIEAVFRP